MKQADKAVHNIAGDLCRRKAAVSLRVARMIVRRLLERRARHVELLRRRRRAILTVLATVQTGLDVLEAEKFAPLRGKHVGIITNHTGVDAQGRSTVEVLTHAPACRWWRCSARSTD